MAARLKQYFRPEISVILTVYNRKILFLRALNSVLGQTFKNYEIIIIDDGSNDGLGTMLYPILREKENIIYIRHTNQGHPYALNTGIKMANCKYITFLDSDDEYEKKHLEKRIKYMQRNKHIDLIYSDAKLVGSDDDFYIVDVRDRNKLIHVNECIVGGTFFGKKDVFTTLNGFQTDYGYDYDFWKRAIERFNVKKYNSKTYIYHRDNEQSITSLLKKDKYDKRRKIN
jgi:glycosyltransferase involved in cell wall biosynthesis